jgi:hypothetical protein
MPFGGSGEPSTRQPDGGAQTSRSAQHCLFEKCSNPWCTNWCTAHASKRPLGRPVAGNRRRGNACKWLTSAICGPVRQIRHRTRNATGASLWGAGAPPGAESSHSPVTGGWQGTAAEPGKAGAPRTCTSPSGEVARREVSGHGTGSTSSARVRRAAPTPVALARHPLRPGGVRGNPVARRHR